LRNVIPETVQVLPAGILSIGPRSRWITTRKRPLLFCGLRRRASLDGYRYGNDSPTGAVARRSRGLAPRDGVRSLLVTRRRTTNDEISGSSQAWESMAAGFSGVRMKSGASDVRRLETFKQGASSTRVRRAKSPSGRQVFILTSRTRQGRFWPVTSRNGRLWWGGPLVRTVPWTRSPLKRSGLAAPRKPAGGRQRTGRPPYYLSQRLCNPTAVGGKADS